MEYQTERVRWEVGAEVGAICVSNTKRMRGSVSLLSIAIVVSGLQGCHHKHNNSKLGPLSNNNNNNNNIRNNLNNMGRRRRRQTFNNVLGGNSNLPNTGLRSQTVPNTNPGLNNNNRQGSDQNYPLQPWSKLYWPRW